MPMRPLARLQSWLRATFRRRDFEHRMQQEMQVHLELYEADLRRSGVPPDEARRRAHAEFGSVEARKDECREASGLRVVDELRGDAGYALRLLRRAPAFTTVAVLTVALGIAANAAIFSVIYATFFEPLPYRDPDRLVMVWSQYQERSPVSPGDLVEWKRRAAVFEDLEAWGWWTTSVSFEGRVEQMSIGPATPGFLPMLGYGHPLALGRDFLEEEGTPGREHVVILTHRVWRERLGSDPAVVGRQIRINRKPYTIVGVLGAGPPDENAAQLWVPFAFTPAQLAEYSPRLLVMGRLKPGVTLQQANANMDAVSREVARTSPHSVPHRRASVQPFRNNFLSDDTKRGLWLLLAAVVFVLLIACANVANLLLARGTARQRELAVRASLGASRRRIVRQLLVESVLLAILGGALGVALASGLLHVIVALMPPFMLPTEAHVRMNLPILLFSLAACGLSGILFGAAPAWQAARTDVNEVLKEGGRSLGPAGSRLRHGLVVLEFALALTLLAAGGLAIRSLFTLTNRDFGARIDRVLTFSVPLDEDRFAAPAQIVEFYRLLLERVGALPGVVSASASTGMPIRGPAARLPFSVAGRAPADPSTPSVAGLTLVTPAHLDTFGIRVTRGRAFTEGDRQGTLRVAIVNETLVRRYFPDADPLTQRLLVPEIVPGVNAPTGPVEWQIVGVRADVRSTNPENDGLAEIDLPFWQSPWPYADIAVRTAAEPGSVSQAIARVVQSIDGDLPVANVKTLDQIVSESLVRDRFNTVLFASFAAAALLLAAVGIYGVMSFAVAQRTHEIGLRMALGANRRHILHRIVREGMATATIGAAIGSVGAFYAARTMRGIVSGVTGIEVGAYASVILVLLGAALVACIVPAARAASVDPIVALRQE